MSPVHSTQVTEFHPSKKADLPNLMAISKKQRLGVQSSNSYHLTVPVGQEFKGLSGWFWLRIPNEIVIKA